MTKKQFVIWAVVIGCIHIGLVLFFGMQKQGFHEDEYYTYWSVSSESIEPQNFTWHNGHELQRRFLVREGEQFSLAMVVQNQAEDVHPPLYYVALHIFMSFFAGSLYKWFGILLNLLFSLVTYAGILFLFSEVRGREAACRRELALLAGLVYVTAPSTVSCIMLTRMYAMSTMWTVLYGCVFVLLMNGRGCSRRKFAAMTVCGAAVCYCAFLTHYYALFVPFFLTLAYCLRVLVKRREMVRMLVYGVSMLGAIGLAVLTYPVCIYHIFRDYRGTGAITSFLGDSLFGRAGIFLNWVGGSVFSDWLIPCLAVFLVFAVIGVILSVRNGENANRGGELYIMTALGVTCAASFWVLSKVALPVGEVASRYFYPMIALLLPYMAYVAGAVIIALKAVLLKRTQLRSSVERMLCIGIGGAILVLAMLPAAHSYASGKVLFLYEEDAQKVAFAEEYSEYPLLLVYSSDKSYRSWYVDNQVWPFEKVLYVDVDYMDRIEDATISGAEKIVVYMDAPEEYLQSIIDKNPNLSTYTMVRHDPFFYVYLLE